jgi:hypothetical protein
MKTILIISCICFIIGIASLQIINKILESNGIAYQNTKFYFPSGVFVGGFEVKQPGIQLKSDSVSFDWSWVALLKGNFQGDLIRISNVSFRQWQVDGAISDTSKFQIPNIKYRQIRISNAIVQINNVADTLYAQFPDLRIFELNLNDSINIDSIVNKGSKFKSQHFTDQIASTTSSTDYSIRSLPEFTVKHLQFDDCDFQINVDHKKQSISQFDLQLTGVKSNDLLHLKLNRLAFNYQNTIDVQVGLDSILINNQDQGHLSNLSFVLPGLEFNIPDLTLNNFNSPEVNVQFQNSFIKNSFLQKFFPSYALPVKEDVALRFEGGLAYHEKQLILKNFLANLSQKSFMNINGSMGLSTNEENIRLLIAPFATSLYELFRLTGQDFTKVQNDIKINGDLTISGIYNKIQTKGSISLNEIPMGLNLVFDQSEQLFKSVNLAITAQKFEISRLLAADSSDFKSYETRLNSTLRFNSKWQLNRATVSMTSDSLKVKDYQILKPDIQASYKPGLASLFVKTDTDSLRFYLETKDDIRNYAGMAFKGNLSATLPTPGKPAVSTGDFYSTFNGDYTFNKSSTGFLLHLDSIRFKPVSGKEWMTDGLIKMKYDAIAGIDCGIEIGNLNTFKFRSSASFVDWINDPNRKSKDVPNAALESRFEIDSILIKELTGTNGFVQLENFKIDVTTDTITANLSLPVFQFGDYLAKDLSAKIKLDDQLFAGNFQLANFYNPFSEINDVRLGAKVKPDKTTAFALSFGLPEIDERIGATIVLKANTNSFQLYLDSLAELQLGEKNWKVLKNEGITFSKKFEMLKSQIAIANDQEKISFESDENAIQLSIDSLNLSPVIQKFIPDNKIQALLNLKFIYRASENSYWWSGLVNNIVADSLEVGNIKVDGTYIKDELQAVASLKQEYGDVNLEISKKGDPVKFNLNAKNIDLGYLNALPGFSKEYSMKGKINASLSGTYDEELNSSGFVAFNEAKLEAKNIGLNINVLRDSLWLNKDELGFKSFHLTDNYNQDLTIDGDIKIQSSPDINLKINSTNFRIFDQQDKSQPYFGNLSVSGNLALNGPIEKFAITGTVNTLPNGFIHYLYKSSVSLDDREKVLTFNSLTYTKQTATQNPVKPTGVTNWNVDVNFGKTELYITLDETVQDYAKLTATGNLQLRKGVGNMPLVSGSITSSEGSLFYDAPMVSDLNLKIQKASVDWKGEFTKPTVTFKGSEVFRVPSSDIPGSDKNKKDQISATVLALVDNCELDNFIIHFDVKSNNATLANYLQSMPPENRETTAINLLLFGSLNSFSGGMGGSSPLSTVVSKLNELSRKNIKKADLSFYIDSETAETSVMGTVNKLGYSFSEGILNQKVRVTLGGNVDFSDNAPTASKKFNPLGTIQLEYKLSENPDISIFASRKDIYKGVVDGQVSVSSAGFSFQRKFRNLFQFLHKQKKK